ncbi:MAG: MFS transporter [Candidatus Chisholmbacteria bacterium]|nr:MFS transporter [Candidatus Chisholmbacteria bacterium]
MGLTQIVVQLKVLPFLVDRLGEWRLLKVSIFIFAVSFFALLVSFHPLLLLISVGLIAPGQGLATPAIQALASETVSPKEYGETLGIMQSAGSLGRIAGPVIGGLLFTGFSKSAPYIFVATLLTLTVLFLLSQHQERRQLVR